MSGSLRIRLLGTGALAILVALAAAALGLGLLFERHVERRILAELASDLDKVIASIDLDADGALTIVDSPSDPRFAQLFSGYYWQALVNDRVFRSRSLWDSELSLPPAGGADGDLRAHRISGPAATDLLLAERTVTLPARLGSAQARVAIALDRAEIAAATSAFRGDLLPYLIVVGVLLLAASFAQVTIGLRPLKAVRARLAEIKSGRVQRLGEGFPDEVRPLVREVDSLLDTSENAVARASARASDLAHALKTPLQVLSGDVERLKKKGEKEIAEGLGSIAATMQRVVDRELTKARLASGSLSETANVALVVEQVLGVVQRTPNGERLAWRVEVDESIGIRRGADSLAEALGNLVENAARHAQKAVSISADRRGDMITVVVRDDGEGIAAALLASVIERGVRIDQTGSGAGLGLAIVADIADAAGGRLDLVNENPGFAASLVLPARHEDI